MVLICLHVGFDEPYPGAPKTTTMDELQKSMKTREISEAIVISKE